MNITLKLLRFLPAIALLFILGCEMEENTLRDLQKEVGTDVLVMDYNARRTILEEIPGKLVAGQNMEVGTVDITVSGGSVYVTYTTNGEWCLSEIHVDVASDPLSIPQGKKGNPQVGNFDYVKELDECVTSYTAEIIPIGIDLNDCFYVAAHAVVNEVIDYESDLLPDELPEQVTISVSYPGGDSYFNTTVSGGSILDGTYDGWCIDTDRTIASGTSYTADVLSSYGDLPEGTLEFPENLDLVNWIINESFVGQPSGCDVNYTYGDVQRAIWELIEDDPTGTNGPWKRCRVDEIKDAALASGEDFEPECGEKIAIILVPVNGDGNPEAQITVAQITLIDGGIFCDPIPGDGEETAWGSGTRFAGKGSWAMYFPYNCPN